MNLTRRGLILSSAAVLGAQTKKAVVAPKKHIKVSLPGGKALDTASWLGNVYAVTIFKTTCPHCQKSLPISEKIYKEFSAKGFRSIAIAVDQNPEPLVVDFAKNYKIDFPLGWAPIDDICAFLDLKPEQLYVPAMMIFDRRGNVRGRYPGGDAFFNMEEINLRNQVELLLKEPRKS
ncbi:TlpA disulfide reductase family protein [Bryobacter aggregatus]|uniref:TlpA disulfide reductase family protein n=1 Tax=Bryobacter aggregatus TaxID=360054 RepID=UPI0004E0D2F8|nr:TlpA disulfide reductase family protein [Bryobacter aggregatus]